MRKLLLLLVMVNLFAAPEWYHHLSLKISSYYVGYGQGESEAEAKRAALTDIASQITVTVDSRLSSHLHVQDDTISKDFNEDSTQVSYAKITGYETLKLGYEEGIYYVALGYENIPSIDKFNKKLALISVIKPEVQNRYLKQTPIARELIQPVDFALKRRDGIWYIRYKEIFQALDERDFSRFFTSTTNPNLSITTNRNKRMLYEGDEFYFNITSRQNGYVTVFTVYEDGTTATLLRNTPVKKNQTENIPDKDFESVLQAGLIESGVETFDLYVVVYSKEKQHYDRFAYADEELIKDERYKNFDELIAMLDDVEFVTLKVVTKPR